MAATAVQAHRGSPDPANGIAENTLEAFARAQRLGADGIELDVRLTVDGALAVHHDPVIPGVGTLCELTASQLPGFVPRLSTVLEKCEGMTVNIEIKNLPGEPGFDPEDSLAERVADLLVSLGRLAGVVVSSFWPGSLAAVHRASPEVPTGLLLAGWFDPATAVHAAVDLGCAALHPQVGLITEALVAEAHGAGLSVAAWTVNDRTTLETMGAAGVDTVITDDVTLARATLGAP